VNDLDERVRQIIALHFDPQRGASYWIERARTLPFDPVTAIQTVADLRLFGPFPAIELASRPVEDFVPRVFHHDLASFITSETGGTTGRASRTVFRHDEFIAAFVTPFVTAAARMGFPHHEHWLFVGPSGPHVIGKGARACAAALESMDIFAVDFDPRWARKLPPGSFSRQRYMDHVIEQALDVLTSQRIGVLFSTPPVLEILAKRMDRALRERIAGVHLGGVAADAGFWSELTNTWFPNAVAMSGYGNSLFGVCPQLVWNPAAPPEYFVHGDRLVVEPEHPGAPRGPLCFHRLDESTFLPYVRERDEAEFVNQTAVVAGTAFQSLAIRDPRPPAHSAMAGAAALY
jgi:hypothetical protein